MIKANDPNLTSFVHVDPDSHFPIQNLPFGVFRPAQGNDQTPRCCSRIGEYVVDLSVLEAEGIFADTKLKGHEVFNRGSLNYFMGLGRAAWREVRSALSETLRMDQPGWYEDPVLRDKILVPVDMVTMQMPVEIGDYTDFYSSEQHARNVGSMFRDPENALMPNWKHLPVGYHGRASSVILSGQDIYRPKGQTIPAGSDQPVFGPCKLLDFELEMGFFTGPGNKLSEPIPISRAGEHIFGLALVNDWSARDIQKWEYQPLGPFLAKNFATSISPWIVTLDALQPFKIEGPEQDPEPLPYLQHTESFTYDVELEVSLQSMKMDEPFVISQSNYKHMYWNMAQQLAHHTITGCNVRPGDMYASGTISGPTEDSYGSMLELAWKGTKPIQLPNGEERKFLNDGDTLRMSGYAQGDGYRVGFGEVVTQVQPAK